MNYYNNSNTLTKHVHYVYDVYDHLLGKQLDPTGGGSYTTSEWYALDLAADPNTPALPVLQFDKNGNEAYRYLNAAGVDAVMGELGEESITTQGTAGTTTYALADNLGTNRDIVNTGSTVVDHVTLNSFGQVAYESGTVHHWAGYAGYHLDGDTGLAYADHRWYDPSVGRWISEDPLGFAAGDPNVSRYVGNDTTNAVDATGLITPLDSPLIGIVFPVPPTPPDVPQTVNPYAWAIYYLALQLYNQQLTTYLQLISPPHFFGPLSGLPPGFIQMPKGGGAKPPGPKGPILSGIGNAIKNGAAAAGNAIQGAADAAAGAIEDLANALSGGAIEPGMEGEATTEPEDPKSGAALSGKLILQFWLNFWEFGGKPPEGPDEEMNEDEPPK